MINIIYLSITTNRNKKYNVIEMLYFNNAHLFQSHLNIKQKKNDIIQNKIFLLKSDIKYDSYLKYKSKQWIIRLQLFSDVRGRVPVCRSRQEM